jgi:D-glycero-alpha-D-manno-heptose-7-phosphate kinase
MREGRLPLRVINAVAPIRICDIGGWTDTWFSGHGNVFNIAVSPYVVVQVKRHPIGTYPDRVLLVAENVGARYTFDPAAPPGNHPLLETTVADVGIPNDAFVEINVFSEVPAGCATGTSAAATVALIGALDFLNGGHLTPYEVALRAHHIETERLGVQSGIQDQLCAAYGGVNSIEMSSYPHASVSQLSVPNVVSWELERRLVLLYLGRAHVSSDVHDRVIARLEREGEGASQLEQLRQAAQAARDAFCAGDFSALGRVMVENTEAQAGLHPGLVSSQARAAISVAGDHGALGWKVNGAGGEGGSLTLLCGPDMSAKRQLLRALREADPLFQIIPISLSPQGLRVWEA